MIRGHSVQSEVLSIARWKISLRSNIFNQTLNQTQCKRRLKIKPSSRKSSPPKMEYNFQNENSSCKFCVVLLMCGFYISDFNYFSFVSVVASFNFKSFTKSLKAVKSWIISSKKKKWIITIEWHTWRIVI